MPSLVWVLGREYAYVSCLTRDALRHIGNMSGIPENVSGMCRECVGNVSGMCREHVRNCGPITLSESPGTLRVTSGLTDIHSYLRLPVSVRCFISDS